MRILIAGCGAVGGVLASALNRAGAPFVMTDDDPAVLEAVRDGGLKLKEGAGEERLEVDLLPPRELEGPFDAVFLAVKGPRLGEAMRAVSPRMHRDTFFLPLQAGWPVAAVAGMVEPQRVAGGLVGFHAAAAGPGVVELLSPGALVLGEPGGSPSPRLRELEEIFEGGREGFVELTGDIVGRLWSALRLSACLGSLGALAGSRLQGGAAAEEVWEESLPLWEEVVDLAGREGVSLGGEAPGPDPAALLRAARPYASSVLDDLERGLRTEDEFTNGFLAGRAQAHGVRAPVNTALRSLIKEMEKGLRAPGPANLQELRRRVREERGMGLM